MCERVSEWVRGRQAETDRQTETAMQPAGQRHSRRCMCVPLLLPIDGMFTLTLLYGCCPWCAYHDPACLRARFLSPLPPLLLLLLLLLLRLQALAALAAPAQAAPALRCLPLPPVSVCLCVSLCVSVCKCDVWMFVLAGVRLRAGGSACTLACFDWCVRACLRACVCVCVRACTQTCISVCVCV